MQCRIFKTFSETAKIEFENWTSEFFYRIKVNNIIRQCMLCIDYLLTPAQNIYTFCLCDIIGAVVICGCLFFSDWSIRQCSNCSKRHWLSTGLLCESESLCWPYFDVLKACCFVFDWISATNAQNNSFDQYVIAVELWAHCNRVQAGILLSCGGLHW